MRLVAFIIMCCSLVLLMGPCPATAAATTTRKKEQQKRETIQCRITATDVIEQDENLLIDEEYCSCILHIDNNNDGGDDAESSIPLAIEGLPLGFMEEHQDLIDQGALHATLSNVVVDREAFRINFCDDQSSIKIDESASGSYRRLQSKRKFPTSLAFVRVNMGVNQYELSRAELNRRNLVQKPNIVSQLRDISYGKIRIRQATVYDVFITNKNASSYTGGIATTADVEKAMIQQLGVASGKQLADKTLMCIPGGTRGKWVAVAHRDYWLAVFNGSWCSRLSVLIHEFGHTIGLGHSSVEPDDQNDRTCYMSRAHHGINSPAQTFNAHKSYLLGLYRRRHLTVKPSQGSQLIQLSDFADYKRARRKQPVLVVISELGNNNNKKDDDDRELIGSSGVFLHYNRQKGFNNETRQYGNFVTVTRGVKGRDSHRLAALRPGQGHVIEPDHVRALFSGNNKNVFSQVGPTHNIVVQVCEEVLSAAEEFHSGGNKNKRGTADVMLVSITVNGDDSLCPTPSPVTPTTSPTVSKHPSTEPSNVPSGGPSTTPTWNPTSWPSLQPTRIPTLMPTTNPSSHPSTTPTVLPTIAPTTDPTMTPSVSPSPTQVPTLQPSHHPSVNPTSLMPSSEDPTPIPSPNAPTTRQPSQQPSSVIPTLVPTLAPSDTQTPSQHPSLRPSFKIPTPIPSSEPTFTPSTTTTPTQLPTAQPTSLPPTLRPSFSPSVTTTNTNDDDDDDDDDSAKSVVSGTSNIWVNVRVGYHGSRVRRRRVLGQVD